MTDKEKVDWTPSRDLKSAMNFSPYDTLEHINCQANSMVSALDSLPLNDILNQVRSGILNLVSNCQEAIEAQTQSKSPQLNSSKEPELEDLQLKLRQSEIEKQKMHAAYHSRLKEIDQQLDEIIFEYKSKWKSKAELGNLLDNIEEEKEEKKSDEWDIQLESEDSSGPPSQLVGSALNLYNKLHDLRSRLCKYKKLDLETSRENSLDQGLIGSLPISLQSISNCSMKMTNLLQGLKSRDTSLLKNSSHNKTTVKENRARDESFSYMDSLAGIVFSSNGLTDDKIPWQQKEKFIMTLMEQELPKGRDVCLEDLMNVSNCISNQSAKQDSNSFYSSITSFLQDNLLKNEDSVNLTFKKPNEVFRLTTNESPENETPDLQLSPIDSANAPNFQVKSPSELSDLSFCKNSSFSNKSFAEDEYSVPKIKVSQEPYFQPLPPSGPPPKNRFIRAVQAPKKPQLPNSLASINRARLRKYYPTSQNPALSL